MEDIKIYSSPSQNGKGQQTNCQQMFESIWCGTDRHTDTHHTHPWTGWHMVWDTHTPGQDDSQWLVALESGVANLEMRLETEEFSEN